LAKETAKLDSPPPYTASKKLVCENLKIQEEINAS